MADKQGRCYQPAHGFVLAIVSALSCHVIVNKIVGSGATPHGRTPNSPPFPTDGCPRRHGRLVVNRPGCAAAAVRPAEPGARVASAGARLGSAGAGVASAGARDTSTGARPR